jgi:hypothetical protein
MSVERYCTSGQGYEFLHQTTGRSPKICRGLEQAKLNASDPFDPENKGSLRISGYCSSIPGVLPSALKLTANLELLI